MSRKTTQNKRPTLSLLNIVSGDFEELFQMDQLKTWNTETVWPKSKFTEFTEILCCR